MVMLNNVVCKRERTSTHFWLLVLTLEIAQIISALHLHRNNQNATLFRQLLAQNYAIIT